MGVRISAQLLLFAQSILLGLAAGTAYGVLRPFRQSRPRLAPALDLLYGLSAAAACSAFLLRPADGILRGYTVLGAAGGAVLWFCGFDEPLRPLWRFWADTAACAAGTALLPVSLAVRFLRNLLKSGKSLFYFAKKCCTIKTAGLRRARRRPKAAPRNASRPMTGRQRRGTVSSRDGRRAGKEQRGGGGYGKADKTKKGASQK